MMRMDRRGGGDEKSESGKKRVFSEGSDQKMLQKLKRVKIGAPKVSKGGRSPSGITPAKNDMIDGTAKVVSTKGFYRKKKELKEEKNLRRQKRELSKELSKLEKEMKRMKKKDARKAEKRSQSSKSKKEKFLDEIPWEERSQYKARRRAIRRNKKVSAVNEESQKVIAVKEESQNKTELSKLPPLLPSSKNGEAVLEPPKKTHPKKIKLTLAAPPKPIQDDATDVTDLSSTARDSVKDDAIVQSIIVPPKLIQDDATDVTDRSSTKTDYVRDNASVRSSLLKDEASIPAKDDVTVAPKTLVEKKIKKLSLVKGKPISMTSRKVSYDVKRVVSFPPRSKETSSSELKNGLLKQPSNETTTSEKMSEPTSLSSTEATIEEGNNLKLTVETFPIEPVLTEPLSSPSIKQWATSPTVSECLSPFYAALKRRARKRKRRLTPSPSCESVWSVPSVMAPERYQKFSQTRQSLPPQSYTVEEIRSMMAEGGAKFGSNIKRATLDFRQPKRAFLKDYERFLAPTLTQVLKDTGKVIDVVDLTCYKVRKATPRKVQKRMFLNNPFEEETTVQRLSADS